VTSIGGGGLSATEAEASGIRAADANKHDKHRQAHGRRLCQRLMKWRRIGNAVLARGIYAHRPENARGCALGEMKAAGYRRKGSSCGKPEVKAAPALSS